MDNLVEYWDTVTVAHWLSSIGYHQYEKRFKENEITGEVLLHADHDTLKELKVKTVGHRLAILKALRELKVSQGYEADETDSEEDTKERRNSSSSQENPNSVSDIARLEEMIRERDIIIDELFKQIHGLKADLDYIKALVDQRVDSPVEAGRTSTVSTVTDAHSLWKLRAKRKSAEPGKSTPETPKPQQHPETSVIRVYGHRLANHENESYKTILVHINDTCTKVLPLAMKKWKINEDWKKYALFIEFKGQSRCLTYDDRPLAMLYQHKDKASTPYFYLQTLRTTESMKPLPKGENRSSILDAAIRSSRNDILNSSTNGTGTDDLSITNTYELPADGAGELAVAIYEYMAERDDELDVNIGDEFIIRDKSTAGWWVVERNGQTGWVPSGCLLEKSADETLEEGKGPVHGVALFDYEGSSANELSIKKDNKLIVHKKYQHWLLAEHEGKEGWVPSCYVSIESSGNSAAKKEKEDNQEDEKVPDMRRRINTSSISMSDGGNRSSQQVNGDDSTDDEDRKVPLVRSNKLNFRDYVSQSSLTSNSPRGTRAQSVFASQSDLAPKSTTDATDDLDDAFLEETQKKVGEFSKNVARLKDNQARNSFVMSKKDSISPSKKLDSLLDSFDPYLTESDTGTLTSTTTNKLTDLLNEISMNLESLHENVAENAPSGSQESLTSIEHGVSVTKDLANLIESVQPDHHKYDEIMEKLQAVMEEGRDMMQSSTNLNETSASQELVPDVKGTLNRTYAALNDVASLLLQEAENEEPPVPPTRSSRKNNRDSRLIVPQQVPGLNKQASSPKDDAGRSNEAAQSPRSLRGVGPDGSISSPPMISKKK